MNRSPSIREMTGRTLPWLLDEACELHPNEHAFGDVRNGEWVTLSNDAFRARANELAAGLRRIDAVHGDRVALLMHSNVDFMLVDMACAVAGLITTPVYLKSSVEVKKEIFRSSEPRAVVLDDFSLYADLEPLLKEAATVKTIVFAQEPPAEQAEPLFSRSEPPQFTSLKRIAAVGRKTLEDDPELPQRLREEISPSRVLTLIYTSGTTGRPKGVMLTHENMTFDALAAYSGLPTLGRGSEETMLSFLPMTHAFARLLNYGAMHYGFTLRFTDPDSLSEHLRVVRPTIMATVPRMLEKMYERIVERGSELGGIRKKIFEHALELAENHRIGEEQNLLTRLDMKVADRLVFRKWREAVGGRMRFIISGGAALEPRLNHIFAAAGLTVLQGYGLTETSPVISFNRPSDNRPETVGTPLDGVEVRIADDREILTRGPHVMQGYYRNPKATREAIDEDGWLHTDDLGDLSPDGFLTVTGRKNASFKLSTGKFVVPGPVETVLTRNALIEHALLVGRERKYCVALIFVNENATRRLASDSGLDRDADLESLLESDELIRSFQKAVDEANRDFAHWQQVQRFSLLSEAPTIENGLLTPTLKMRRPLVEERFADRIEALYDEEGDGPPTQQEEDAGDERTETVPAD